ncbi:DUF2197 domain-containing protein [Bacillaceae bacterium W0354]
MRAKCILCDKVDHIDSFSLTAKKLRKRRMQTYLCEECHERISNQIEEKKKKKAENK